MSKDKKKGAGSPFAELAAMRERIAREEEAKKTAKSAPRAAPRPKPAKVDPRDEEVAFHRLMAGVVPLDGAAKQRVPRSATEKSELERRRQVGAQEAAREEEAVHEKLRELVSGGERFEVVDDGARVEGRRQGVAPDLVRKLRRGQLPVDARLDMHEMGAAEAREALTKFLADKRARGERCVLVIHGKGEHSPRGVGVLRGEIAAWLSQGAASHHVAAFATAHDEDGGQGATYVLLQR
jgi:DNA-nicking Smr family endonuclease